MKQGSQKAREELIEAHIGLAVNAAKDYVDDEVALADALAGLVEGVDDFRVSSNSDHTLPAYLKVVVRRAAFEHKRDNARHFARIVKVAKPEAMHPTKEHELLDAILASCEDEKDKRVVELLKKGMSHEEVSAKVLMSRTSVTHRVRRMYLRFQMQQKLNA